MLWPWHRVAAIALFRPLVWESPYAAGAAPEKDKKKKKKKKRKKEKKTKLGYLSKISLKFVPQNKISPKEKTFSPWVFYSFP